MNRFFAKEIDNGIGVFDKEESYHLSAVLRMDVGKGIEVVHDKKLYDARIIDNNKHCVKVEIIGEKEVKSEPTIQITLFQSILKGSKIDFAVQKCTELGIYQIVPIITKRCVAKGNDGKVDRLRRIAYESCKQCKRVAVPEISECVDMREVDWSCFDLAVVAYEEEEAVSLKNVLTQGDKPRNVAIIIGPEGGFEMDEITMLKERGVKCASLGFRILRSETAGMAALTATLYHYGEMEI